MNDVNQIDQATLDEIQDLIRTNLVSRDSLYAAAKNLDSETLQRICRRLADELGGHVAELQQFLLIRHKQPIGPEDELVSKLRVIVLDALQHSPAEVNALEAGEKCAQQLKQQYEDAIDNTGNLQAKGILHQQRKTVESGEDVLRALGELKREASH
jgi:uncharacterized protein (TIGR02284 family)